MNFHLVVVRAFGPYRRGDAITDAATATAILAGENARHVVRVTVRGS